MTEGSEGHLPTICENSFFLGVNPGDSSSLEIALFFTGEISMVRDMVGFSGDGVIRRFLAVKSGDWAI